MVKSKFKPGDAVVTSAAYARVTKFKRPIEGTLIKQTGWQADVWHVRLDGFARPERLHSSMFVKMEKSK